MPEKIKPHTKLVEKEKSPLIIRRYSTKAGILFVSVITDENLDNLDELVHRFLKPISAETIQECRNLTGNLSDFLLENYERAEGVAVVLYADKMLVSSLWGDFMSHDMCRSELYLALNFMTKV